MSILEEEDGLVGQRERGTRKLSITGRIMAPIAIALLTTGGPLFAQSGIARLSKAQQRWVRSIHRTDRPVVNTSGAFDTRFSMADFPSAKGLFETPRLIRVSLRRTKRGGISSIADAQAIFPGSPRQYALAIAHLTHYHLLSYRTVFSADRSPSDPPLGYHLQIQAISAGVLGIDQTYLFATNNYGERLPGHAYGFKWNLERSYKASFRQVRGSWFIAPVRYQGAECTYLRYFNDSIFSSSPPIPLLILQHATGVDYRQLLSAAFHAATAAGPTKR